MRVVAILNTVFTFYAKKKPITGRDEKKRDTWDSGPQRVGQLRQALCRGCAERGSFWIPHGILQFALMAVTPVQITKPTGKRKRKGSLQVVGLLPFCVTETVEGA